MRPLFGKHSEHFYFAELVKLSDASALIAPSLGGFAGGRRIQNPDVWYETGHGRFSVSHVDETEHEIRAGCHLPDCALLVD